MSLEATMILIDNSDHSRNGDFMPSRWEAQKDAVTIIANKKMNSHPDNSVGLMTFAGKQVEVLCTPCQDSSLIIASLHDVQQGGRNQLSTGIQIAQLALKHRQNKIQRQRIVVMVASPVLEEENKLEILAKKLKKNNVAVDIINMGQIEQDHIRKLEKFIEHVNSSDNSHFLNINAGINPSDQLYGTAIMGGGQDGFQGQQQGGIDADLGFDPNLEPELALAMRISLEEERKRQEEQQRQQQQGQQQQPDNQMQIEQESGTNQVQGQQQVQQLQGDLQMEDDLEQDELLRRAMELSLQDVPQEQQQQSQQTIQQPQQTEQQQDVFQDQNFVSELLGMIPDLNKNDEQLKKALDEVQKNKDNNNNNNNNNQNNQ